MAFEEIADSVVGFVLLERGFWVEPNLDRTLASDKRIFFFFLKNGHGMYSLRLCSAHGGMH